jgi:hypothetical protein
MAKPTVAEQYQSWLSSITQEALARRAARFAALKTPQDVAAWAKDTQEWYRASVGPLIPMTGEPRRISCGTIQRDGFRIEKWLLEVFPGTFDPINLYVPDRPNAQGVAIVMPEGHSAEGKAAKDYQNPCAYFAYNGIPTLVYDHSGNGERREYWNRVRGESIPGRTPTSEHDRTGDLSTLAGIQPVRWYITEAARMRDFLASFPFARRENIGITGVSGGGTMSRYAAAHLGDFAFCIPVCIVRGEDGIGGGDAEQNCWDAGVRGVAAIDLVACTVPRPAMLVTETSFDATGRSYARLRKIYDLAGAPATATDFFGVDDEHGYTHPMTEAVYNFIARQYGLPAADHRTWNHIRLLPAKETFTGQTGFVQRDRVQVTLAQQIKRLAPKAGGMTRDGLLEVLRIADWQRSPVPYGFTGQAGETVRVTGATAAQEGELGLLDWTEAHPPEWWVGQSFLYRSQEADASRDLLAFGRSLVGLRVRQILDFLEDHRGKVKSLTAERDWAVPLTFACALAGPELLLRATVRYLVASFRDFFDADLNTTGLGLLVPGLLAVGDVDDVIALSAGRLEVQWRIDPDGRVVA